MSAAIDLRLPAVATDGHSVATWTIGGPRLLAGLDGLDRLDLRAHLSTHGPLPATDLAHLLSMLDASRLAGRGGAGFALAAKLRAVRGARARVIVNGSESEPASHKDRTLLRRTPHLVIDGALAVASCLAARRVVVGVHDRACADSLKQAVSERSDARIVRIQVVTGGFVAGEARALVRALDGGPAMPPGRREHATDHGDLVSNVETLAQLAILLRMGPSRFASSGTRTEPGTTLLSISGAVARPGVVEIPIGTPLGIVLSAAGAYDTQAIVTGGYHGSWLAPDPSILLSRDGVAATGGTFGAGVLLAIDSSSCALGELGRATSWLAAQSAKQCGPCRFGLPALAADVHALYRGDERGRAAAARHARSVIGRGACSHPDGAARFVTSGMHLLQQEIDQHLRGGCGRPVRGFLPIGARL